MSLMDHDDLIRRHKERNWVNVVPVNADERPATAPRQVTYVPKLTEWLHVPELGWLATTWTTDLANPRGSLIPVGLRLTSAPPTA